MRKADFLLIPIWHFPIRVDLSSKKTGEKEKKREKKEKGKKNGFVGSAEDHTLFGF